MFSGSWSDPNGEDGALICLQYFDVGAVDVDMFTPSRQPAELMEQHYDPRYARTRLRRGQPAFKVLDTESLDDAAQQDLARRIADLLG